MLRRLQLVALLVLGSLIAPLTALTVPSVSAGSAQRDRRECVVYITRTGARYHVDGCRYLRQSRIPVPKRVAEEEGYTPCRVCGGSDC